MERIGIYGGTFNPPHIGHIQAAKEACKALSLSKLYLLPDLPYEINQTIPCSYRGGAAGRVQ